jgi:hypothetical protein
MPSRFSKSHKSLKELKNRKLQLFFQKGLASDAVL